MKRIQPQLLVAFTSIILIVLCMISLILLVVLRQTSSTDIRTLAELNTQAQLITTVLRRNDTLDDRTRLVPPLLKEIADRNNVRIALVDNQKQVIYDSDSEWVQADTDLITNLKERDNGTFAGEITWNGERWLAVAHPLPTAEAPSHYVVVARFSPKITAWERFRNSLAKPILQSGLVALALGIILSLIISRSIATPLKDVAQAATSIAQGQLDARAPETGPEEVRQTARAFNEMAQKVQASQTAQKDLVANIAHDLRTPLTSIQGYAQALTDGTANTAEAQAYAAQVILDESQRLKQMTTSLVDLARFEAGQINLAMTGFDMRELVRDRVAFYETQAHDAGIRLTAQLTDQPMIVKADAARIIQVLDNLMSNALRHTSPEGRIVVATRKRNGYAEVSIADTGTGIPPEDLPRIFERFYRGDKSRQRGGTGLGLAIVQQIIQAHGGTINVESVVGVGTKFTFSLQARALTKVLPPLPPAPPNG